VLCSECGVLFCVLRVICMLCLTVVPPPQSKTAFAVKTNNNNIIIDKLHLVTRNHSFIES
jgi:hypothetical protein